MPALLPPPSPPPARRCAAPLPAYRYVPGLQPHPFRHPAGHLYTDGGPPPEAPWTPGPWASDARWLLALDLYDQRYFWECHEALEALWHQVPRDSAEGRLCQGLIQAAASVLKAWQGQPAGAARLQGKAIAHLEAVARAQGPCWRGVDLPATVAALRAFHAGGAWPLLGRPGT